MEHLKKELKSFQISYNNCNVRLTRALEENEKLKSNLKNAKDEEKVGILSNTKKIQLTSNVKNIEKQKMELLNGFKKQMQLIDVLKKQKVK